VVITPLTKRLIWPPVPEFSIAPYAGDHGPTGPPATFQAGTNRQTIWARRFFMARLGTSRRSFNPEALSQIALIVDDVWKELAKESAYDASGGRTFVARKVFQLADAQWSAIQIKQLLLRAVRNKMSVRRRKDRAAPAKM
jgi:hypothetical protein